MFKQLKKLPPILQININRFDIDYSTGTYMKVNSKCEFNNTLDFESILSCGFGGKGPKPFYHLHAILIHSGTLDSGHYYCFIRPEESDAWFKFNDKEVTPSLITTAFTTG